MKTKKPRINFGVPRSLFLTECVMVFCITLVLSDLDAYPIYYMVLYFIFGSFHMLAYRITKINPDAFDIKKFSKFR